MNRGREWKVAWENFRRQVWFDIFRLDLHTTIKHNPDYECFKEVGNFFGVTNFTKSIGFVRRNNVSSGI